jgi:hypothetical protein
MVSHFQNDADRMVQNKPRIESYTKPYVRSILLAMGVESEVEVMDNVQENFFHWSHVLCTLNIRWTLLFMDATKLRQKCHNLQAFVDMDGTDTTH